MAAAALGQLGDGVGGVVGPHVGDDVGHLFVGHVLEEPVGGVGVQLLEHVRLELGVGVHHVEDLLALLARGVLEQVGDLRRLEPADPTEPGPGPHAGRVADQRFEGLPVLARVAARAADETEEAGRSAGVEARHHPALVGLLELDVPGPDQFGVGDVDEPVAQNVLAKQHLALAALEAPQVDLGFGQHDSLPSPSSAKRFTERYTRRPPTLATRPVTSGRSPPRRRTMTSSTFPTASLVGESTWQPSKADRFTPEP